MDERISKMSLEDKIALTTGRDMWNTKEMKQYGIPSIQLSDGPHGLRTQLNGGQLMGINDSLPSTCFPAAVTAANSWNLELLQKEANAIAEEAQSYGVAVVLGPGCNIKRNPLGGRNFEYYSEDPYQAGKMAAAFIKGIEEKGVASCLKHFACNNQEYKRQNGNSIVDERALHEIYLKPFEIAVREGHPSSVMCSYNRINGVYSSDNKELLTDILRNEWGFDGLVVTDWGAMNDRIRAFQAGCDLNMPGGSNYMESAVRKAVEEKRLDEKDIDASVNRILKLVSRGTESRKEADFDFKAHHSLAKEVALEGAVLLKNEENVLPLDLKKTALIGHMAEKIRYQGSGSSHINPTELSEVRNFLRDVPYVEGVNEQGELTSLEEALSVAGSVSNPVIFAGLPDSYESEAFDREHMRLPERMNALIEKVAEVNANTVVVLCGGSAMELPWADKVKGILYLGLGGQAAAESAVDLLSGKCNPSGKLSESWPFTYEDVLSKDTFKKKGTQYRESIYVGYRYYDKANISVRYPYGYGLSYTSFEYTDMRVEGRCVSFTLTNSGKVRGKETVQMYVSPKDSTCRARKELKGFQKVELEAGESRMVCFELNDRSFSVYQNGFKKIRGAYEVLIGASSRDIRLRKEISVEGEAYLPKGEGTWYDTLEGKPTQEEFERILGRKVEEEIPAKKGSYTLNNTCLEMKKDSIVMKIQYWITKAVIASQFKKEERNENNASYKMMLTAATDCPIRGVIISSNGAMPESVGRGLVEMANGHFFRGLREMLKKE